MNCWQSVKRRIERALWLKHVFLTECLQKQNLELIVLQTQKQTFILITAR